MFVYVSPLIGGLIADRFTGYRKAVMIGGFFFMAGHATLSIPAIWAVYLALTFLVIGNGFFKPNVSTMVGNLYPEGSHLKDRAYNIFYMGINVGAALAPIVMEIVKAYLGLPCRVRRRGIRNGHLGRDPLVFQGARKVGRRQAHDANRRQRR